MKSIYIKTLTSTFVFVLLAHLLPAQSSAIRKGNRHFEHLAFASAIKKYEKVLKKNPNERSIILNLADSYRKVNDPFNAEIWYQKAVNAGMGGKDAKLHLGEAMMSNGKYDEAIPFFKSYLSETADDERTLMRLHACENINDFLKDSAMYDVRISNVNSDEADFGPAFYGRKVIFASARSSRREEYKHTWNGNPFLDLYEARYSGKQDLGEAEPFSVKLNTKYHEAITSFSPDLQEMFFTRNNFNKGKVGKSQDGVMLLKLYHSRKKGAGWTTPIELHFNRDEYSAGHPALGPDGKFLYFVSDMPGGVGGTDLYKVERKGEDEWGDPINLGPEINTTGNEMFPWISPSGILFFASNGHPGMGGLDIFQATEGGFSFENVKNLGYPINSPKDDFSLIVDGERRIGFFTSNRTGGKGDDDIYSFKKHFKIEVEAKDVADNSPVPEVLVEIQSIKEIVAREITDSLGRVVQILEPNQDFFMTLTKQGYEEKKVRFTSKATLLEDIKTVVVGMEKLEICDPIVVLYCDVDNEKGQPAKGTVVRVEEKIQEIKVDKEGKAEVELLPDKEYIVTVLKDSVPELEYEVSTKNEEDNTVNLDITLSPEEFELNKVFYIIYYNYDKHNIRKDASEELERVVAFMTKYPSVKVELSSHTDSRGSNAYNERLSQNRAIEAFDYITSKGISKDRLTFRWAGERELTNKCADGVKCSEQAHQLNRRTEFKLTGF